MNNNEYLQNLHVDTTKNPESTREVKNDRDYGCFDKRQYDLEMVKEHFKRIAELNPDDYDYNNPLFEKAIYCVLENGKYSAFMLQRKLNIGFNMAKRYIDKIRDIMNEC